MGNPQCTRTKPQGGHAAARAGGREDGARDVMRSLIRVCAAALRPLVHAALPAHCALCGGPFDGSTVCGPCAVDYAADLPRPRCPVCANPVREGDPACGRCLRRRPPFDATVAAADYAAPLDRLVLQLKFAGALHLAPWFARALADAATRSGIALPELLCPVPLGAGRLASRGFNQALEIARPLARQLDLPLHPALAVRTIETQAQSAVHPAERARNLRGAFTLPPASAALVAGRHVGLVDDVMTSGHTLAELAACCKRCGAARVTCLVFARTPPA